MVSLRQHQIGRPDDFVFGVRGDFKQCVVVRCHRPVPASSEWAITSTASNSTAIAGDFIVKVEAGRWPRSFVGSGWFPPAVPETIAILDLIEGWVEGPEFAADTLDCAPHIRPIALSPGSCEETLIAQPVIDRTVS
jgi:hypothetical protein